MLNCGNATITIFIVLIAFNPGNAIGSSGFLRWPNADQIVQLLCPSSSICGIEKTIIGPMDPCCTECLCGDECNNNYECCIRENNKTEFETCLYLRSRYNNFFAFVRAEYSMLSYYVVTKTPHEGCFENKGKCESTDTSTIYPVYSETTKKIYFDVDCALCHGVDKVVEPEYYVYCDELGSFRYINFDEEISKFLEGDKSSLCYLSYTFPSLAIDNRICSIHAVDSIDNFINVTNETNIRRNYNMSLEDIAEACISSFYSPTYRASKGKMYPNPFCYLYGEGTHEKDFCYQSSGNPLGLEFTALLNPKIKAILPKLSERRTRNLDQACLKSISQSAYQNDTCRPLSCPIGHIIDRNGTCIYFGERVYNRGRMNIYVNLILISQLDINTKRDNLLNLSIDDFKAILQVSDEWQIAFWGYSADIPPDSQQDRREFIFILHLVINNLAKGIELIKTCINKEVDILNDKYTLTFYGKNLTIEMALPKEVLETIHCSQVENISELDLIENDVPNCWKLVATGMIPGRYLSAESLSKLYFCDVVELMSGEYRLLANNSLLFNSIGSKYLHKKEFLIQTDENNKKIVKICLEDSGLYRPSVSASFKDRQQSFDTLMFILIHLALSN